MVTGVARPNGIGRACCRAFLKAGYKVVGVDVAPLEGSSLGLAVQQQQQQQAAEDNSSFHFVQADLTDAEAVQRIAGEASSRFGTRVHVLLNNAGIAHPYMPPMAAVGSGGGPASSHDTGHATEEQDASGPSAQDQGGRHAAAAARLRHFDLVLATNLRASFLLAEALLPHLARGDSSIIHVSSTRALQSEPNCEAYAATKAGLLGLTHAQAASLKGLARVNCILPGWVDTADQQGATTQEDADWHWAGRVGLPDDIAQMAMFLADASRSGFITGQQFVVDGGTTRQMYYPD